MPASVARAGRFGQDEVRFRLGVIGHMQWLLNPDPCTPLKEWRQEVGERVDAKCVMVSNWRQLNDLPRNKLNAVVFAEDAALAHLVVIANSEFVSCHFGFHRAKTRYFSLLNKGPAAASGSVKL